MPEAAPQSARTAWTEIAWATTAGGGLVGLVVAVGVMLCLHDTWTQLGALSPEMIGRASLAAAGAVGLGLLLTLLTGASLATLLALVCHVAGARGPMLAPGVLFGGLVTTVVIAPLLALLRLEPPTVWEARSLGLFLVAAALAGQLAALYGRSRPVRLGHCRDNARCGGFSIGRLLFAGFWLALALSSARVMNDSRLGVLLCAALLFQPLTARGVLAIGSRWPLAPESAVNAIRTVLRRTLASGPVVLAEFAVGEGPRTRPDGST